MLKEKSCGAVVFRRKGRGILYLLLHYEAGHWDFPKGNQEKNELEKETATREIKEETGINDIKILKNFNYKIKYFYRLKGVLMRKEVSFYLAETKTEDVKISFEHTGFEWMSYQDALERVTYKNSKELLKKANIFLTKR